MSDNANYVDTWKDVSSQCQSCKLYQTKEGKNACVPEDKSFEEAIEEYGEVNPNGHCNFFEKK